MGAGLEALTADETLAQAARQHAAEMADLGYFSHSAPGETAVFWGEHSSPPQTLAAGTHTLKVSLSDPPTLPLAVGLGRRSGKFYPSG